jgi:hypothetical protein
MRRAPSVPPRGTEVADLQDRSIPGAPTLTYKAKRKPAWLRRSGVPRVPGVDAPCGPGCGPRRSAGGRCSRREAVFDPRQDHGDVFVHVLHELSDGRTVERTRFQALEFTLCRHLHTDAHVNLAGLWVELCVICSSRKRVAVSRRAARSIKSSGGEGMPRETAYARSPPPSVSFHTCTWRSSGGAL